LLLVVDDDEGAREVACLVLERAGFDVKCAVDGEQAIALFQEFADQVRGVVLDHTMPGISGAQVLDALRGIDPDVPVVMISGYARERIADDVLGQPGVCFVSKPFDERALVGAMMQLLDTVGGR
jgi:CheY-like chemotaxis protein